MSQHDYNIANGGGSAVRADINSAMLAVQSQNSGATAPTTTKPYMPWYDTANGVLKFRNAADTAWMSAIEAVAGSQGVNFRNRIINGDMRIDQRNSGAVQTVSAGSIVYTLDRFLVYAGGSSITSQRVGSVGAYSLQLTGNTGNLSIQVLQRIEANNIVDLAGQVVTYSFDVSSTTVTVLGLFYNTPTATDNYTALNTTVTVASSIPVTPTKTRLSYTFTLPANASNGLQIFLQAGTFTSGTLSISNVQLESGAVATPFERRPYGTELALCQRYFQKPSAFMVGGTETTNVASFGVSLPVSMRTLPTFTPTVTSADIRIGGSTTTGIAGTWSSNSMGTEACGFAFQRTTGTWTVNASAFLNQSSPIGTLTAEL